MAVCIKSYFLWLEDDVPMTCGPEKMGKERESITAQYFVRPRLLPVLRDLVCSGDEH